MQVVNFVQNNCFELNNPLKYFISHYHGSKHPSIRRFYYVWTLKVEKYVRSHSTLEPEPWDYMSSVSLNALPVPSCRMNYFLLSACTLQSGLIFFTVQLINVFWRGNQTYTIISHFLFLWWGRSAVLQTKQLIKKPRKQMGMELKPDGMKIIMI